MARFDVYPTPIAHERRHTPYWLDVQSDHLRALATRVVVPLRRCAGAQPMSGRLQPVVEVAGAAVYLDTSNLAAYPHALLRKPVANLSAHRLLIDDALDFLFSGF